MITIKEDDRYNRLTAIKFIYKNKYSQQFWLFKCDCGNEKIICVGSVKNGNTKSCGCLLIEGNNSKHRMSYTRTYNSWNSMIKRCLNKNSTSYKYYGGRGIIIYKDWLKFENFYKDMGDRPENKTLDRIDNNKGYSKKNCKWSTSKQQISNRRNSIFLTHNGKTQTMKQWSEELNIKYSTIQMRIKNKWEIERALSSLL